MAGVFSLTARDTSSVKFLQGAAASLPWFAGQTHKHFKQIEPQHEDQQPVLDGRRFVARTARQMPILPLLNCCGIAN